MTPTATIYHNPRCSKSRAALALLDERGYDITEVRYLDTPLTAIELRELISAAGLTAHDAVRKGEAEYKELGLSADTSDDELVAAMASHPKLIERPFVKTDRGVRLARPTEVLEEIL